jgi:S-adenosylmethionine decarboxylase
MMHQTNTTPSQDSMKKNSKSSPWGVSSCIDLYDCDPQIIRDADMIKQFVSQLLKLIDMKSFGPCHVVHFGQDPKVEGFSMFQLIETSCVSGHFSNQTATAYLDIFSCKVYDSNVAAAFCKTFFKAKSLRLQSHQRL